MGKRQQLITSLATLLAAVVMFFSASLRLPYLDEAADAYFLDAVGGAAAAYTACRLLNGTISVLQESSLQLEPAGLGISLAAGQVLDPVNDMTERVSTILVMAISATGVQKLVYEISSGVAPPLLAILLLLFAASIWIRSWRMKAFSSLAMRLAILVCITRLCLPLSAMAGNLLQETFIDDRTASALEDISPGTTRLDELLDISLPQSDGFMDTIENSSALIREKSTTLQLALQHLIENMSQLVDGLLQLAYLYIGIFLIQVIFLPILSFWLLLQGVKLMTDPLPRIFQEHPQGKQPD